MTNILKPTIYVACLAAYNNGFLHGAWIDANQSSDLINDEIQAMLKKSPIPDAEEWAIHDYEDFGNIQLSEHQGLNSVSEIAAFVVEHGELGAEVLNYRNNSLEEARRTIEECYHGDYETQADFARSFVEETTDMSTIPEHIVNYIDYESMAHDWFLSDDFFAIQLDHKLHVFSSY